MGSRMKERNNKPKLGRATIALHSDRSFEDDIAIAPALHQSVTYRTVNSDEFADKAIEPQNNYFYTRHGNPTSSRTAKVIAELEGGEAALMFSSGMGAITTTILAFVNQGDQIIAQDSLYSATASFLRRFLPRYGVDVKFVDQTSTDSFAKAITAKTKAIFVETPTNPLLTLTDLKNISNCAKKHNIVTICDNTLATPINQTPFKFGIDIVVHSATKYIAGHHDLLAGCVVASNDHINHIWDVSMDLGPIAAPFNSWLALRGIRTLKLRVDQQNKNALSLAHFLKMHPAINHVYYPGLRTHPQHELATRQMDGFGGILSFNVRGGLEAARSFARSTTLCMNAPSLGGVDTLIVQPAEMFRARLSDTEIRGQNISPGLIRMSVGIEEFDDLCEDIDKALAVTSSLHGS